MGIELRRKIEIILQKDDQKRKRVFFTFLCLLFILFLYFIYILIFQKTVDPTTSCYANCSQQSEEINIFLIDYSDTIDLKEKAGIFKIISEVVNESDAHSKLAVYALSDSEENPISEIFIGCIPSKEFFKLDNIKTETYDGFLHKLKQGFDKHNLEKPKRSSPIVEAIYAISKRHFSMSFNNEETTGRKSIHLFSNMLQNSSSISHLKKEPYFNKRVIDKYIKTHKKPFIFFNNTNIFIYEIKNFKYLHKKELSNYFWSKLFDKYDISESIVFKSITFM